MYIVLLGEGIGDNITVYQVMSDLTTAPHHHHPDLRGGGGGGWYAGHNQDHQPQLAEAGACADAGWVFQLNTLINHKLVNLD